MRRAVWIVVLLVGCNSDQLTSEERAAVQDLAAARKMAAEYTADLKAANDLKEDILAWTESIERVEDGKLKIGLSAASTEIYAEFERRKEKDGNLLATQWYHAEVVGVEPEKIIEKWAPDWAKHR
jgi:hypothetical protein